VRTVQSTTNRIDRGIFATETIVTEDLRLSPQGLDALKVARGTFADVRPQRRIIQDDLTLTSGVTVPITGPVSPVQIKNAFGEVVASAGRCAFNPVHGLDLFDQVQKQSISENGTTLFASFPHSKVSYEVSPDGHARVFTSVVDGQVPSSSPAVARFHPDGTIVLSQENGDPIVAFMPILPMSNYVATPTVT
jgi:hypothetical protein